MSGPSADRAAARPAPAAPAEPDRPAAPRRTVPGGADPAPLVVRTVAELRAALATRPRPVGFVPTMGALHDGHRALVARARAECATVVASVFVNPTQFGPGEDYERYPRDEASDLRVLAAERCDIAFLPGVPEIYPPGDATVVHVSGLTEVLEGAARPGHFDGVTTVVARLFAAAGPDRAYFGQKDAQQLVVIERMVRDLHLPVTVVRCATVREPDGLARSSRNVYLDAEERRQAAVLSAGLRAAAARWAAGERDADALRAAVRGVLAGAPLAQVEYVSLADAGTLAECHGAVAATAGGAGFLLSLAVRFGATRLIDNTILDAPAPPG